MNGNQVSSSNILPWIGRTFIENCYVANLKAIADIVCGFIMDVPVDIFKYLIHFIK